MTEANRVYRVLKSLNYPFIDISIETRVVEKFISKTKIEGIDPKLIASMFFLHLANYGILQHTEYLEFDENEIDETLSEYQLTNFKKEFVLISKCAKVLYNQAVELDHIRPLVSKSYKELDKLSELLSIKDDQTVEIVLKTRLGKTVSLKDEFHVGRIIDLLQNEFLDPTRDFKYYKTIDYKSKGRPTLKKTLALKCVIHSKKPLLFSTNCPPVF